MITIEHYIEDSSGQEFCVTFHADIGNDGIGHYEFHGQRWFDRGSNYIEEITFEEEGLTPEQITLANELVKEWDTLEAKFSEVYCNDDF